MEYLENVPYVMSPGEWNKTRDSLLLNGDCTLFSAFSMEDKHFQQLAVTVKPPISMKEIGNSGAASHEAWRDVKDYYETLHVWNFFCSFSPVIFQRTLITPTFSRSALTF